MDEAGDRARADDALVELLRLLGDRDYRFTTPTPATHARVVARAERAEATCLEDVLGWSLPYPEGLVDGQVEALLEAGGMLAQAGRRRQARVRVSRLRGRLFLHSAYPTSDGASVFFGPDSYRFAELLAHELAAAPCPAEGQAVDIGTGSGVGAIVAADCCPGLRLAATDVNPAALRFARVNARAAGIALAAFEADTLAPVPGPLALATANPPFLVDEKRRLYRDGGGMHGGELSLTMAGMAAERLAPGGRLILYTASAVVRGEDRLEAALARTAAAAGCAFRYRELDPDVFGEELDQPAYLDVDRIALVAAVLTRPG